MGNNRARSIMAVPSHLRWVRLACVDAEVLDRAGDFIAAELAVTEKLVECGDDNAAGIDLEKAPQRRAVLAPAETVGSQRRQAARNPSADRLRQRFHVIAGGDVNARLLGKQLLDVTLARRL